MPPARMIPKKGGIPDEDPKNPQYWERRIGYPPATREWLDGRNSKEESFGTPVFSCETFCRGYNLVAGQYYPLKRKAVRLLMVKGLFKMDWNRDVTNARWGIADAEYELHEDPLLNLKTMTTEKPEPFWANYMVHAFLVDVKNWMNKYAEDFDNGDYHISARWTHGPDSTFKQWKWDGYYQYQHLEFNIRSDNGEVKVEAHRVLSGLDGVTYTPEDINPDEFKWEEFERELKETELGFDGKVQCSSTYTQSPKSRLLSRMTIHYRQPLSHYGKIPKATPSSSTSWIGPIPSGQVAHMNRERSE